MKAVAAQFPTWGNMEIDDDDDESCGLST